MYPATVQRLIEALKRLPGVGTRTAERLAFHMLRAPPQENRQLAESIADLADGVASCSVCFNLAESDPCGICRDPSRDRKTLLVVEQPRDVPSFEEAGWRGLYHVLLGHVNPAEGLEAGDLTIAPLAERVREGEVREIVLATDPDYEGDATALCVTRALAGAPVTVTRIARGIASGSAIEYSNASMLSDALAGRSPLGGDS